MPANTKNGDVDNTADQDDTTIDDDDYVIRYIPKNHLTPSQTGNRRLSRGAFSGSSKQRDPLQGMSVDILSSIVASGSSPEQCMSENFEAAVKFRVGDLRKVGLRIGKTPKEDNPFHADVWGVKKSTRGRLLELAEWVLKPDDVD